MAVKKEKKKQGVSLQGFDIQHYKHTEGYVQAIDALYNQAVAEYTLLAGKVTINPDKPFSFNDYPQTKNKAQQIVNQLAAKMQSVIINGSREQWLYACNKNDEFLASILNTSKVPKKILAKYQDQNLEALKTFQGRKVAGMGLSDRIWNYTGQMKTQMELGIDIALGDGKSAQQLSKDLRQYLVDPDKLFRRVRDKHGNLALSKAAKAYHPGQGKYRSSYKNAMRLTRSEINMAYRESDQLRWRQLDFVTGFEIKLSNNHTTLINGVPTPFKDICDDLDGKYPKSFTFKGWHPQCRCAVYPIMMDRYEFNTDELNEMKAALNGTEYKKYASNNTVEDVPDNFKKWIQDNAERSQNWSSQPYWIRDNFNGGTIAGGLSLVKPVIAPPKPVKPIKTEQQKEDIHKRWNTRQTTKKFDTELQAISDQYVNVNAIKAYTGKINDQINSGASVDEVSEMVDKLKNKVSVKQAWEVRKQENSLGKILDNVKNWKTQFSTEVLKSVYNAVEAKLKEWDNQGLSQSKLQDKLKFEIDFLEKKQKYITWKVAQDAYKKKLIEVEYQSAKQAVVESVSNALTYAVSTKSPLVKQLANELQDLVDSNAPISSLNAKASELNKKVKSLSKKAKTKASKIDNTNGDTYSQERKDAALWAKTGAQADNKVRDVVEKVWKSSTPEERIAAYRYTAGSSYINEPLRSMHYSGQYSGVYNGKLDTERLTTMIDKSTYDFDMWVQRGVDSIGLSGVFGYSIYGKSLSQVTKDLVGKTGTEPAFSSCGVAKNTGFGSRPIIYNIYCPRGTKMMYLEPFSHYGSGAKSSWNGISKQSEIGSEAEMLLQRGTQFRVTKVDKSKGKWYIDVEIIAQ